MCLEAASTKEIGLYYPYPRTGKIVGQPLQIFSGASLPRFGAARAAVTHRLRVAIAASTFYFPVRTSGEPRS